MNHPIPLYDTRKHFSKGIEWRGYLYTPVPVLRHCSRLMIVEDHEDYLIVADYHRPCGWHTKCTACDERYVSERIGTGRPTKARMEVSEREEKL